MGGRFNNEKALSVRGVSLTVATGWSYDSSRAIFPAPRGDIAQLGERGVRNAEVGGSTPPISTNLPL